MDDEQYRERMLAKIWSINKDMLTPDECAVMSVLMPTFSQGGKVMQEEIAASPRWLACHPEHEAELKDPKKRDSALRIVRQVISDLRNKYGAPIISDEKGYSMCHTKAEAVAFIARLENLAKKNTKSYFSTYSSMKQAFDVESQFFEQLQLT